MTVHLCNLETGSSPAEELCWQSGRQRTTVWPSTASLVGGQVRFLVTDGVLMTGCPVWTQSAGKLSKPAGMCCCCETVSSCDSMLHCVTLCCIVWRYVALWLLHCVTVPVRDIMVHCDCYIVTVALCDCSSTWLYGALWLLRCVTVCCAVTVAWCDFMAHIMSLSW